jgi:hypothetical protein
MRRDLAAERVAGAVEEDWLTKLPPQSVGVGIGQRDAFGAAGGRNLPGGFAAHRAGRHAGQAVAGDGDIIAVALQLEPARDQIEPGGVADTA